MTRSTGTRGLTRVGLSAEILHGVAKGREVDDAGNAREVLQEDAGGRVGDLAVAADAGGGVRGQ